MYDYDEYDEWDDTCEVCEVGRLHTNQKPYLTLHKGKCFTIPDATCYICDVCGHVEYDDSIIEIIDDMIFGSTKQSISHDEDDSDPTPPPKPSTTETGDSEQPKRI